MAKPPPPDDLQWIEDAESGLTAVLVLDAVLRGRAFGGIRVGSYPNELAAAADAKALARAMTLKCAFAGIDGGGAKTVVYGWKNREAAMRALGRHIHGLGGRYYAGADLGFSDADLAAVQAETKYVACGDIAEETGRTVVDSLDAAGGARSVAVQGLGAVGMSVVKRLRERKVKIVAGDPNSARAEQARQLGCEIVFPDGLYQQGVDAFMPCAIGGVLTERAIARLKCTIVCGGANNPLANDAGAKQLMDRGVTYVPDFVANAGALIAGASAVLGRDPEPVLAALPDRVRELLARSKAEQRTTLDVAASIAWERVAALRGR